MSTATIPPTMKTRQKPEKVTALRQPRRGTDVLVKNGSGYESEPPHQSHEQAREEDDRLASRQKVRGEEPGADQDGEARQDLPRAHLGVMGSDLQL
jgi:hypothetical protein